MSIRHTASQTLKYLKSQINSLCDSISKHLTPYQIRHDRASVQRAVHRAALDTQVERAPETVLNDTGYVPDIDSCATRRAMNSP